jgi:hypothetical protein
VNELTTKASLSDSQCRLLELMQELNFGRIEALYVRGGKPAFDPAPQIIHKRKLGADNGPRPEVAFENFRLKQQTLEMFEAFRELGDGKILAIEVKHGLPFTLEIEHRLPVGGDRRD